MLHLIEKIAHHAHGKRKASRRQQALDVKTRVPVVLFAITRRPRHHVRIGLPQKRVRVPRGEIIRQRFDGNTLGYIIEQRIAFRHIRHWRTDGAHRLGAVRSVCHQPAGQTVAQEMKEGCFVGLLHGQKARMANNITPS